MTEFKLPELKYDYNALEKSIDAKTMEIHYSKHHQAYITNLNNALKQGAEAWLEKDLTTLLRNLNELPVGIRTTVRNNGGGHFNHSLFWDILSPNGGGKPTGDLAGLIDKSFGSFNQFKTQFSQSALTRFGSGWAWLSLKGRELILESLPNQDNPIIEKNGTPILGLDVWEHAYYLRYQNRRADYIQAFWDVIDWNAVNTRYLKAIA